MRTLALYPDFNAVLFWRDDQGQGVADEGALPLSDACKTRLRQFYRWFSELHLASDDKRSRLDARLFDERGLVLWKQLRSELEGRYTVVYYSQEFGEYFETPDVFIKATDTTNA